MLLNRSRFFQFFLREFAIVQNMYCYLETFEKPKFFLVYLELWLRQTGVVLGFFLTFSLIRNFKHLIIISLIFIHYVFSMPMKTSEFCKSITVRMKVGIEVNNNH